MKVYRNIIISICIVIAICFTAILCKRDVVFNTIATGNYPTQEEYNLWEGYAEELAKNLDEKIITDDDVKPSYQVKKDELIVKIDSLKYGIIIEVKYPVNYFRDQNDKKEMKIDFEKAEYNQYYKGTQCFGTNEVLAVISTIIAFGFVGLYYASIVFLIAYGIPKCINIFIQFIKSKKKKQN